MKKYFCLQAKLTARLLPFVLAVALVLLAGMGTVLSGAMAYLEEDGSRAEFTVAVVGDTKNEYLQWGLAVLQTINADRFSIQIIELEQALAHSALEKGQIAAYVVIPEGFMDRVLAGETEPVTYVTSAGMEDVSDLMKQEITKLVTSILVYSQKGSYGLYDAITENAVDIDPYDHMTALSLDYAELILHRDEFYRVEVLGVSDGLGIREYYICAGLVLLLVLMGIPFATLYIRRDYALPRLLRSRGLSAARQLLCEYGGHLLGMLAVGLLVMLRVLSGGMGGEISQPLALAANTVPVLLMVTAMNLLIFTLAGNVVTGLLLHFFGAVSLCYVSGCVYPAAAFPVSLQKIGAFLPTGIARQHLAAGFTGAPAWDSFGLLLAYGAAFFGLALLVRRYKTARAGR